MREDRPLSLVVEEQTGVPHESPQVICLVGGRAVAQASHYDITAERLGRMLPPGRGGNNLVSGEGA